jgi:hypothetical protein
MMKHNTHQELGVSTCTEDGSRIMLDDRLKGGVHHTYIYHPPAPLCSLLIHIIQKRPTIHKVHGGLEIERKLQKLWRVCSCTSSCQCQELNKNKMFVFICICMYTCICYLPIYDSTSYLLSILAFFVIRCSFGHLVFGF